MAEGFLGRWSQRKVDVRSGKTVPEPAPAASVAAHVPVDLGAWAAEGSAQVKGGARRAGDTEQGPLPPRVVEAVPSAAEPPQTPPAAPTLEDAQALGLDSDFKPFAARTMDPAVRNAAMKKLFADPHFNVMDGMDTYIDDYSLPDPLSAATLRKMASAQFLKLFDEEPVAPVSTPSASQEHAHPDLQLQPNHAAPTPGTGEGAR